MGVLFGVMSGRVIFCNCMVVFFFVYSAMIMEWSCFRFVLSQ